jgi:hypothetical protein
MCLQIEPVRRLTTLANSKPDSARAIKRISSIANNTFLKIILTSIFGQDNLAFAIKSSSGTSLLCNYVKATSR